MMETGVNTAANDWYPLKILHICLWLVVTYTGQETEICKVKLGWGEPKLWAHTMLFSVCTTPNQWSEP